MTEVPHRVVSHDFEDDDDYSIFDTGFAKSELYPREISQAEKRRWRKEDAARDKRRIPLGFVVPEEDA